MAYSLDGPLGDGRLGEARLGYLPLKVALKDGSTAEVDFFRSDGEVGRALELFNVVVEEGLYWPYFDTFSDRQFRQYWLSHTALVVRDGNGEVLGTFYIRPNYPDRCAHFCNGGFITAPEHRGRGVATEMGKAFLRIAKDVGYRASYFNLVFVTNQASMRVWEKLGFQAIARVPGVADLKGVDGYTDAVQFYYDLTAFDHRTYVPGRAAGKAVHTGLGPPAAPDGTDDRGGGGALYFCGGLAAAAAAAAAAGLLRL